MAENNNKDSGLNKWIMNSNDKENSSENKPSKNNLDIKTLENWLWEAACKIRGAIDAPKYKDYIIPLIFIKRLSDVFEDEVSKLLKEYGNIEIVEQLLLEDPTLVRFYLPKEARWNGIAQKTTNIGEFLTDCVLSIAKKNPKLEGVINIVDFNATTVGKRIISDEKLRVLIDILGRYRLGLGDVESDIFGRAYEYLLRKFAEGSGQSAGEFYTPREVAMLLSNLIKPAPGSEIYDPCCGSGGLLIKSFIKYKENNKLDSSLPPLMFYGQESEPTTFAMAKMNCFIHDLEAKIALDDTITKPAFLNEDGSLKKFDIVLANPPWNQKISHSEYENDKYNRFDFGYPPAGSADWGWIQHMYSSLKEEGKMAVILDTGTASRGSHDVSKKQEKIIRKEFIEKKLIDGVILLPENLFYNANAPGIILLINKKPKDCEDIFVINISHLFIKKNSRNIIPIKEVAKIVSIYQNREEIPDLSKKVYLEDLEENDYNLIPSYFVAQKDTEYILPLEDIVNLLNESRRDVDEADRKLFEVLQKLKL